MKGFLKILFGIFLIVFISCDDKDDTIPQVTAFSGEIEWLFTFGGSEEDTAQSIIETSDGGYAILGYTNSIDGDITDKTLIVNDYWLLKLGVNGNVQWSKTYGGSADDKGQRIIQTTDGGFAIVGYSMSSDGDGSNNEGFHDNWILRLDAVGNILWEKSFGFSGHDHAYDVVETTDGGFFFSGFLDITASNGQGSDGKVETGKKSGAGTTAHGVGEFWGTKIDANGNLQWRRYFGGTNNDRSHSVVQANDGGFVMAGFSESNDFDISSSRGSYDFWMVKVDDSGNLVWERSFGGREIEVAYAMVNSHDNGYVVAGHSFSNDQDVANNHGGSDIWVIKVNDDGNIVWEKNFGGSDFDDARGIARTLDNGFIISGNSKSIDVDLTENKGENDLWVFKIDHKGNLKWQYSFGGSSLDFGFDAIETSDGKVVLVGEIESPSINGISNKGKKDAVVIKLK